MFSTLYTCTIPFKLFSVSAQMSLLLFDWLTEQQVYKYFADEETMAQNSLVRGIWEEKTSPVDALLPVMSSCGCSGDL